MYKEKIEKYKKKTKRTDDEIAQFLNVKKSVIKDYLSGKKEPDITSKINLNIMFIRSGMRPVKGFLNQYTIKSFCLANEDNYLDNLQNVYPVSDNPDKTIDEDVWLRVEEAFKSNDHKKLVEELLTLEKFPIEDPYVSFLRKNHEAIYKNNETVNRIATRLHKIGLEEMRKRCTDPTNPSRQIGPLFKNWLKKMKGISVLDDENKFLECEDKAIFDASDKTLQEFARKYLGYTKDKGLDLIAKSSNTYILGEAKFLTGFGGTQNEQFDDACSTANAKLSGGELNGIKIKQIAILDGVLYIPGDNHFTQYIIKNTKTIIISSLLLEEYLTHLK